MMGRLFALLVVFITCCEVQSRKEVSATAGTEDGSEEWGYIPVKPGASLFYWLYKTTHPDGFENRPLILWIQGGPGESGTGLGNFVMFGPLNEKLEPRNVTWISTASVLFVDSPVGVGYSYIEDDSKIPTTMEMICKELIIMLRTFVQEHESFKTTPFYVFGQSYGGKTSAAMSYYLMKAIEDGSLEMNFKGAAIGNGLVSASDTFLSYADMLYQMSLLDDVGFKAVNEAGIEAYKALEMEDWEKGEEAFGTLMDTIANNSIHFSIYNLMDFYPLDRNKNSKRDLKAEIKRGFGSIYEVPIFELMNFTLRSKLKIIPEGLTYQEHNNSVYSKQFESHDALQPVWPLLDEVLKNSDIDIIVYQGQLDVICDTTGALRWIHKLQWPGIEGFDEAKREVLVNPDTMEPEMFYKGYDNLHMYWVLKAGHAVPADVPEAALRMLNRIIDGDS